MSPRALSPWSALLLSAPLGALFAVSPRLVVLALGAVVVVAVVARRPHWAAYTYTACTPLIVGLDRGSLLPGIRLNEALLGLLAVGLAAGVVHRRRFPDHLRPQAVDWAVMGLALSGSVAPLVWMYARARDITTDDLVFAAVLVKFALVYAIYRLSVHRHEQVVRVAILALLSGVFVALIGLVQAVGLPAVRLLLQHYTTSEGAASGALDVLHASSTIGASIPYADVMLMSAALCAALVRAVHRRRRLPLVAGAVFFGAASLASGQASSLIGLLIVVGLLGLVLRRLRIMLAGLLLVGVVAAPVLVTVVSQRLETIDPESGLPRQWTGDAGRWNNLTVHVWPQIAEGSNFLLGVRTSARLDSPYPWREFIWIESGYMWALWSGGVLLLIACLAYFFLAARTSLRAASSSVPTTAAVGAATFAGVGLVAILMVIDPHVTMRGSADLLFALVALCAGMTTKNEPSALHQSERTSDRPWHSV